MSQGIDDRYLKELQQVLEAEAALARRGTDLLADPEYCALRELFIDGDVPLAEFLARVEALSASRPEDDDAANDGREAANDGREAANDGGEMASDGGEADDGDGPDDADERGRR